MAAFDFRFLVLVKESREIALKDDTPWSNPPWAAASERHNRLIRSSLGKPEQNQELDSSWLEMESLETAAQHIAWDAKGVANAALQLFLGWYSTQPIYFPDESFPLPWQNEYEREVDGVFKLVDGLPVEEILEIARKLAPAGSLPYVLSCIREPFYLRGLGDWLEDDDPKSLTQALAIESIVCAEGVLQALHMNDPLAATCWMSLAYQRLIDASNAVEELAHATARARTAAYLRHKENYELREQVAEWYQKRHHEFRSVDAAANAANREKLVPVGFRTLQQWISAERKKIRSAGRP